MLTEICAYLHNYFTREQYSGEFTVTDGVIFDGDGGTIPLVEGQYYAVFGSLFSDGVYRFGDGEDVPENETFSGAVWSMAVPPAVVALADEITQWNANNATALDSPYQAESFGGYSYTLKEGAGGTFGWQTQFAARLAPWRKLP